ncbi:MAG TPA: tetratricopeptide repeat protein [Blastocatellia bacterium]|nr:tetratricopeptide repeat protein [Blastocatellia bacterium]
MISRRALSLLFMLLFPAVCSQLAKVPAQTPGPHSPAKLSSAARAVAPPAAEDIAFSHYNVHFLVRALGMALMFYDSIDTATSLPSNLRSLRPILEAADKLRREGDDAKSIATYRTVTTGMEIDMPKLARSYLGQGLICAKIPAQRKKATQFLRQAAYYIPDNSDAHLALALNYCFLLEWDNALMSARRAVLLKPDDANARYWLGWIYFHGVQDNAAAMAHLQEALRLKPADQDALHELAVVSVYRGQYANAVTLLQRVIRLKPDYAEAYWFLGITYLKTDDRQHAQQVYRTLQRIDKDLAGEFAARM